MATLFHKIPIVLISFVLLVMSSGCVEFGTLLLAPMAPAAVSAAVGAAVGPTAGSMTKGKNYYEPEILASDKDMIRVRYLDVNSNAQHEETLQVISKHCGDSYIETYRGKEGGYTVVEAECDRVNASSAEHIF